MQTSRLGDILVNNNLISREQLAAALREQKMSGEQAKLGAILIKQGIISEQDLISFLPGSTASPPSI